jgi:hypothetical protein
MKDKRADAAGFVLLAGAFGLSLVLAAFGSTAPLAPLVIGVVGNLITPKAQDAWRGWRTTWLRTPFSPVLHHAVAIGCERAVHDIRDDWRNSQLEVQRDDPQLFEQGMEVLKLLHEESKQLARLPQADSSKRAEEMIRRHPTASEHLEAALVGLCDARPKVGMSANKSSSLRWRSSGDDAIARFVHRQLPARLSQRVAEAIRQDDAAWREFTQLLLVGISGTTDGLANRLRDMETKFDAAFAELLARLERGTILEVYLRRLHYDANQLPYQALRFLDPKKTLPRLTDVYFPRLLEVQRLSSREPGGADSWPDQEKDPGELKRLAVTPDRLTPESWLDQGTDLVIVSPAGAGKSTLLHRLALWSADRSGDVPIVVPAGALASGNATWPDRLARVTGLTSSFFNEPPVPEARSLCGKPGASLRE